MEFNNIEVRKRMKVMNAIGDSFEVTGPHRAIETEAKSMARALEIAVELTRTDTGYILTRVESLKRAAPKLSFPQIAGLEPGQSVLIDAAGAVQPRVRLAASQVGRKTGAVFRCTRMDSASITVTRVDGVPAAELEAPARATIYGLDRLANVRELRFDIERREQNKLRQAVHRQAIKTDWTIRCRVQDDGSMLVYRTDADAPAEQAA